MATDLEFKQRGGNGASCRKVSPHKACTDMRTVTEKIQFGNAFIDCRSSRGQPRRRKKTSFTIHYSALAFRHALRMKRWACCAVRRSFECGAAAGPVVGCRRGLSRHAPKNRNSLRGDHQLRSLENVAEFYDPKYHGLCRDRVDFPAGRRGNLAARGTRC